jgi:rod shape determining protein RodA
MISSLWVILGRVDLPAFLSWAGLVVLGLLAVYSCTVDFQAADEVVPSTVPRAVFHGQLTWVLLGTLVMLATILLPYRYFETFAWLAYAVSLVLLVLVLFVGAEAGGGRRWLSLGGLSIQPSELAKVAFIFAMARFLSSRSDRSPIVLTLGAMLLTIPPTVLVAREPDLGTSLVFIALSIPMLFFAGVSARLIFALSTPAISALVMFSSQQILDQVWPWVLYVIGLMGVLYISRVYILQSLLLTGANVVVGLAVPLVWARLQAYQRARILSFFDPSDADRLNYGYQTFQSKVAIGSGGFLGKGYLEGSQKGLAFLPERHTDFIFSVIGEEFGLIGVWLVLGLFLLLIARSLRAAGVSRRDFGSMLAVGVASYFCFQVLVNIAITVGLLPVTGLPLPLLSKGGSSMLVSCMMVGLMLNVSARWSEV